LYTIPFRLPAQRLSRANEFQELAIPFMIHVEHIFFEYADHQVPKQILNDVTLSIREGESIAVMGPNGSGKTTFARCLNALLIPGQGLVTVDGLATRDFDNIPEIRRRVGIVFQNPDNQIVSTTVEREVAFGLENLGVPYDEMHQIVDDMLEKFHLQKYRRHSPHHLSGGEKQRLAFAAVMAMKPRYLVMDEPTSLLDPKSRREILQIIRDLHRHATDPPMTTIFITQFPEEALIADRLIILNQGTVYRDGEPNLIFNKIDDLEYIGLDPPVAVYLTHLFNNKAFIPTKQ
jgi:energy-coupling factor transport system ATP-binding protein